MVRYFVCPSTIYRPNAYSVCKKHSHLSLTYDDVYPDENGMAIIRHEDKAENSTDDK